MKWIKVAAGVLNQTPLDWEKNTQNILNTISQAKKERVSILCLPELCITGYGTEDMFHSPSVHREALNQLKIILPKTKGMIVSLGLPVFHKQGIYNTACLVADGKILGFAAKQFLAGDGIHYEPRWFKPWKAGVQNEIEIDGKNYPIGDIHFNCGDVKIGFEICEDAWVADRPGINLALKGIDIILNPSASHFAFNKINVRKRFVLEGSRSYGVSYVYANLLGNESGRVIFDGCSLIATQGTLVAEGPRFSYRDSYIVTSVIDVEATRMEHARITSFQPQLKDGNKDCIKARFIYPKIKYTAPTQERAEWEDSPWIKEEEFTRAVSLGLYDYLRKSYSNGFVVSLSGGADSAAVTALIRTSVELGIQDIGQEAFLEKISYIKGFKKKDSVSQIVNRLLTCAYQRTENSGQTTFNAAKAVANAVGAQFYSLNVDPIYKGYLKIIGQAIGRELTWNKDDITMQNLQARTRSPGIWMLANINNALLLSTSNRSEAAVGYATMDGDTSGGLSPIAGIDKNFLRSWLRWVEKIGPDGLNPLPALRLINEQQPTAELRPSKYKQTDEDDLMPYDFLDAVEKAAIRDKKNPIEVYQTLQSSFGKKFSVKQMGMWIERFFKLWCRNQWKRERYAPSFHLDDENLDPKTWCRFPILSGGFIKELEELNKITKHRAKKS
jgi:NAD+ synthase (glutamine-hydrolysing)